VPINANQQAAAQDEGWYVKRSVCGVMRWRLFTPAAVA
jgi:hypothetical protein